MQFLVLAAEGRRFALPLSAVSEILRGAWPTPVPRAPFGCLGALDVRGAFVPLLDLSAMLGLRKGKGRDREHLAERLVDGHVVLVRLSEAERVGLLVDRVAEVTEGSGNVMAPEADVDPRALAAAAEGERALLLDPSTLFGPNRRKLLARVLPAAEAPR